VFNGPEELLDEIAQERPLKYREIYMAGAERILILEDDAIYARTLAETLSPLGEARFTSYPERVPERWN